MEHDDLQDMVRAVRQFVRSEVVPEETTIEENDAIPGRIRQQAIDMGLYGFALPIEHGGLGMTMTEEVQLVFELGYTTPAFRSMFGTNNGIAGHVLIEGGTRRAEAPPAARARLRGGDRRVRADRGGGRL